jgi:hypothetical protein
MTMGLADLVGRLTSAGRVTASDVLALRAEVYGSPQVTEADMEALIGLDAAVRPESSEWIEFFAGAMTDYVVRQEEPQDHVDQVKAAWLMHAFSGETRRVAEVEAMVRILETAESTPPTLESFVLAKLRDQVAANERVSALDVGRLKRMVFAAGGEENIGVTREEADILFDIDDATHAADNDPTWADFFAKAIAASLMSVSPVRLSDRDQAIRTEAWLQSRGDPLSFLARAARGPDIAGATREVTDPYADMAKEWTAAEARLEAEAANALPITEEEGHWLLGRLGDAPSAAGHHLIELVALQAPEFSDDLARLLDQVTPAAAAAVQPPEPFEAGDEDRELPEIYFRKPAA